MLDNNEVIVCNYTNITSCDCKYMLKIQKIEIKILFFLTFKNYLSQNVYLKLCTIY